jgi:uncharacterized protein YeeX (DUF496 family)
MDQLEKTIRKSFATLEAFKNAQFEMERAQLLDRIHYLEEKVRDQQKRLELHDVLKNGGRLACDNKLEAKLK